LEFRPAFARSLPVQILLTGVVLTLVAVLFIHLIFTAQYHWPLAPVNYVLQLSGVTTLLISLIATLHVVLSATFTESEKWPYMLSYIAVNVPPLDYELDTDEWNVAERATWLVMNASTSGLIQVCLELIFLFYFDIPTDYSHTISHPSVPITPGGQAYFCLARFVDSHSHVENVLNYVYNAGPLAIVAAVMQLLPIHGSADVNVVASAIKNVCNATLSLLFTAALFIWGLLVNRRQAWRTDGGTAAFGAAALTLAIVSTALNFLYVPREEEYVWLPSLMWAVVLWQSFLGWWWWVGAGSGSGLAGEDDLQEKLEREAKRESRRKEARERRRETKQKAKNVWKGVAGAFINRDSGQDPDSPHTRRRSRSQNTSAPAAKSPPGSPVPSAQSSVLSASSAATFTTLPRLLPAIVHRWYASLRHAHLTATRQQDLERVERIRELGRNDVVESGRQGWGLGSFGWRIRRDSIPKHLGREFELHDRSESATRHRENADQHQVHDSNEEEPPHNPDNPIPPPIAARPVAPRPPPRSVWWWGPLARWRLQDSTVY
jgi:hypothetical protein